MREMRRKDRQLTEAEARVILEAGEYGILAMTDEEGNPYGVPVSYAVHGDAIYFHGAMEGHKTDCLLAKPQVCFTVVGKTSVCPEAFSTNYESVIVFGTASRLEDEERKERGLRLLVKKYSPDFLREGEAYLMRAARQTAVWRIQITQITGKARRAE